MTAALLFAVLMLQGNMAPTFSEGPEEPAAAPVRPSPVAAKAEPNKTVSTVTVTAAPVPVKMAGADPVSCQTSDVTGTRFAARRCMTKSQWDQQARDAKDLYAQWSSGAAIIPTK